MFDVQAAALNPCGSLGSQENILQLIQEQKLVTSFVDSSSYSQVETLPDRFETSDVVLRRDNQVVFAVFDNSFHVGAFCTPFGRSLNCTDQLLAWPDASLATKQSGFEGITYNPIDDTYFIAQEAIKTDTKKVFRANIFETRIVSTDSIPIRVLESCIVNWDFASDNKGIEGLEFVSHQGTGKSYLLGLCEANECNHKSTSDNDGRILVLEKKEANKKNSCSWEPVGTIAMPAWVHFDDYSALSIYHRKAIDLPAYVAVTSQERSQVWVGMIEEINQAPFFSLSSLNNNTIYDLPRTSDATPECGMKYCNIEGVAWQGGNELILVSDKTKSDQDTQCIEKDQSVHYFFLP
ncbi:unnamed protein product [Rotaria socialis]|uniref:Uncharacterized protein n=1 Tax=Rotaria socialis TaxID=392032 RepID=A0A820LFE1_9BILA|nr:unnamed protein product [Rotaria socialis]CAF3355968.1 unnamed protein product [Rotaria socialis]CAF3413388.1 unnamed protein product [Rotaria socialis]CAF3487071.1 unnamed protein product [Rotaria socialis]CAF3508696.1 unnamed protein product [Rotaria socialis]